MKSLVVKYWSELQTRERWVLLGGTVIVVLLLFYQLLWAPWHNAVSYMEASLVGHRNNLTWINQQAELLGKNGGAAVAATRRGKDQSLMSVIEETARSTGVRESIQQLTPRQNNTQVSVVLEQTSFNKWVRWVDILQSQYGVSIAQLSAEREDKPDVAEIRVTFSRS